MAADSAHLKEQGGATLAAEEGDPGVGAEVQAVLQIRQHASAGAALHTPDHAIRAAQGDIALQACHREHSKTISLCACFKNSLTVTVNR